MNTGLEKIDTCCEQALDGNANHQRLLQHLYDVGMQLVQANQADGECYEMSLENCEQILELQQQSAFMAQLIWSGYLQDFLSFTLEDVLQQTSLHQKILAFDEGVYFCAGLNALLSQEEHKSLAQLQFSDEESFAQWASELIEMVSDACAQPEDDAHILVDEESVEDDIEGLTLEQCSKIYVLLKQYDLLSSQQEVIVSEPSDVLNLLRVQMPSFIVRYPVNAITQPDVYAQLLQQHAESCNPPLLLSDMTCSTDKSGQFITLQFTAAARRYKWTFKQISDWVCDAFWDKVFEWVEINTDGRLVMLPSEADVVEVIYLPKELVDYLMQLQVFCHEDMQ